MRWLIIVLVGMLLLAAFAAYIILNLQFDP